MLLALVPLEANPQRGIRPCALLRDRTRGPKPRCLPGMGQVAQPTTSPPDPPSGAEGTESFQTSGAGSSQKVCFVFRVPPERQRDWSVQKRQIIKYDDVGLHAGSEVLTVTVSARVRFWKKKRQMKEKRLSEWSGMALFKTHSLPGLPRGQAPPLYFTAIVTPSPYKPTPLPEDKYIYFGYAIINVECLPFPSRF